MCPLQTACDAQSNVGHCISKQRSSWKIPSINTAKRSIISASRRYRLPAPRGRSLEGLDASSVCYRLELTSTEDGLSRFVSSRVPSTAPSLSKSQHMACSLRLSCSSTSTWTGAWDCQLALYAQLGGGNFDQQLILIYD